MSATEKKRPLRLSDARHGFFHFFPKIFFCQFPVEFYFNHCAYFRVLLRVRMLYYIKHEVIGDFVQQIADGLNVKYVPFPAWNSSRVYLLLSLTAISLSHLRRLRSRIQRPGGARSAATRVFWSERTNTAARTIARFDMTLCFVSSPIWAQAMTQRSLQGKSKSALALTYRCNN